MTNLTGSEIYGPLTKKCGRNSCYIKQLLAVADHKVLESRVSCSLFNHKMYIKSRATAFVIRSNLNAVIMYFL